MGNLFALLKAEAQTVDLLEENVDFDDYAHWPIYDFLHGHPRYEALVAEERRRIEKAQSTFQETPPP